MNKLLILGVFSVLIFSSCKSKKLVKSNALSSGNKYTAEAYIERFKNIAVAEMNNYGIPASIKLAQGLLESGNGNSELALQANNHFGIKCASDWRGKSIRKDDDEKDECFRVYDNPEDSYKDHSEFLKRKRYASLFELKKSDYEGWAKGLKAAGYATNPKYPELLISLIERYSLNRFDAIERSKDKVRREEKVLTAIVKEIPQEKKLEEVKAPVGLKIYEVKAGDTLFSISKRFGLSVDDLKAINNIYNDNVNLGQLLVVSK